MFENKFMTNIKQLNCKPAFDLLKYISKFKMLLIIKVTRDFIMLAFKEAPYPLLYVI